MKHEDKQSSVIVNLLYATNDLCWGFCSVCSASVHIVEEAAFVVNEFLEIVHILHCHMEPGMHYLCS